MHDIEFDFVTSLLVDPTQLMSVTDIQPGMLQDPSLRAVYTALVETGGSFTRATLHDDLEPVLDTFTETFGTDTRGVLDAFFQAGLSAGQATVLGERIRKRSLQRLIQESIAQMRPDQFRDPEEWGSALLTRINGAMGLAGSSSHHDGLGLGVDEFLERWEFQLANPDKITGIRVNLGKFDALTGGMRGGEFIIWAGHSGEGKALPLSAQVMTPYGPKLMGNIKPNDVISNPDGTQARVLYVAPQGEREILEVEFADGTRSQCDADHLWYVFCGNHHRDPKRWPHQQESIRGRVITTTELALMVQRAQGRKDKGGATNWPRIPLTEPVPFSLPPHTLPLDPYLLGVLIGDGSLTDQCVNFTSADEEISAAIQNIVQPATLRHDGLRHFILDGGAIRKSLGELGLAGTHSYEKFLPSIYKMAPLETRWALVRGLMDTDGYVDATGRCYYDSVSENLADDMRWVLRSLGFAVTKTSKQGSYRDDAGQPIACRTAYRLYIRGRNRKDLFGLTRKRERCKLTVKHDEQEPMLSVVSVRSVGREEAQCIRVDHPNGLFLTDDFVVTHNSQVLIHQSIEAAQTPHDVTGRPTNVAIFSLEMNRQQLAERFVANVSRVSTASHNLSATDISKVRDAAAKVKQLCTDRRLIIVEPSEAYTLDQICRTMVRLKQQDNIGMVCVDYAQLISASGESKHAEMATISQRLKGMAMQLNIPVLCGAQFNREALKESKSARPGLHHIADGIDLARSADSLYAVWTPAKHLSGSDIGSWAGIGVILTLKRRSGPPVQELYYYTQYAHSRLEPVGKELGNLLSSHAQQQLLSGNRTRTTTKP